MSNDWRVVVNDGEETLTVDDGLYDVLVADTFNPFGDFARAFFDDVEGRLFDLFTRGTKVQFQTRSPGDGLISPPFEQRFVGYVVNDLERESDGAEELEVEAYSFDQFLRGGEVSNDQTGNTIFEALEDVITNDVPPVDWDPTLVEVEDNQELTQSYQGDPVEDFLLNIRQKSGGEVFTVTEDLRFRFERPELERAERDIDNSQWINHDLGEEGGETKNQVTVVYNDGDSAITVDESGDQLQTQDNLGASGPAQQGETITREEITSVQDAIQVGEQFLQDREATLTGTVTTFNLNDAEPGQVIGVEIDARGIDDDFRIAENRIRWRSETNELTLVAKKGADDDVLIEQSKTVKRVENRPRDTDVEPDRVTETKPTAELSVALEADGTTADITRFVNDGKNRILDGLINENAVQSFEMQFSTSAARPSRSDSDIADVVATDAPTVTTDAQQVEYSESTTENGIRTIGIRDATEDKLLAVGRLAAPVDSPSATLTLTLTNKPDTPKTTWTNDGLNVARDILAGNVADWPADYGYGSDGTDPSPTDTALLAEVARTDLNNILLQRADTTDEWDGLVDEVDL